MLTRLLCAGLFALMVNALAVASPIQTKIDNDSVIAIHGYHRIATAIQFPTHETILSVMNGDSLAWLTDYQGNTLFIKPILPESMTNLMVITSQKTYAFQLTTSPSDNARAKNAPYLIRITREPKNTPSPFDALLKDSATFNHAYSFTGDKTLQPLRAYDDGRFTLICFKAHAPMPALFIVNQKGQEMLANVHVKNNCALVEGIYRQYTLRLNQQVGSIYNEKDNTDEY